MCNIIRHGLGTLWQYDYVIDCWMMCSPELEIHTAMQVAAQM
jgi:hypothetical protein